MEGHLGGHVENSTSNFKEGARWLISVWVNEGISVIFKGKVANCQAVEAYPIWQKSK